MLITVTMISLVNGLRYNATVYHVNDGYFYYRYRTRGHRFFLKCAVNSECPGRASMPANYYAMTVDALRLNSEHSHLPDPSWLEGQLLRINLRQRCQTEPALVRDIFRQEIAR